jgi:hypothetical protein
MNHYNWKAQKFFSAYPPKLANSNGHYGDSPLNTYIKPNWNGEEELVTELKGVTHLMEAWYARGHQHVSILVSIQQNSFPTLLIPKKNFVKVTSEVVECTYFLSILTSIYSVTSLLTTL